MCDHEHRICGCLLTLSCFLGACCFSPRVIQAQDIKSTPSPKKDAPDEKTIRALIRELGDDSFGRRQAAEKKLTAIGEPALELVRKASKESADAEVRMRAGQIVLEIELLAPNGWHQDFRKLKALPASLKYRNLDVPGHVQLTAEGLQIKVQKPDMVQPGKGIGIETTFGLRGDFEITATFSDFKGETPASGPGVGFGLCIAPMEEGEGAQIARLVRSKDQGILWSGRSGTSNGRLTPSIENAARFRFKRTGPTLYSMWSPGTRGDDFKILNQSEFGTNDIRSVWVNVFTGGQSLDVEGRLLEWRIRGRIESNPVHDRSKSPAKGPPG